MTLNTLNEWLHSVRRTLAAAETPAEESGHARLIRDLPLVVFQVDDDGAWKFLSAHWEQLTGFTRDEALGVDASHFVHPQDRQQCVEHLREALGGISSPEPILVRLICKGGDSRWVAMRVVAPSDEGSGTALGTIGVVSTWVRDARNLESRHRALTTLVDELPAMAYRCRLRRDWSMEYVSGGSLELTGYRPEDLVNGTTIDFGELVHVEDRERVWNEVSAAVAEHRHFELMFRITTRGGKEVWVWERGKAVYASTGEVLSIEGFITDVTRIKKEEERLRRGSLYDSVTGLPATPLFMEHVQHALEETRVDQHAQFALLLLHLHHLTPALADNSAGPTDATAREIYRRVRSSLEAADIICRLDSDRYGVLLEDASNLAELARVCRHLQEQFLSPITIEGRDRYVSSTIGIALSSTRYEQAEQMLWDADIAVNRARNLGGGRTEIFDLHAHARASALSRLEQEFRDAIDKDQFTLLWEPVFFAKKDHVAAIEARLAWEHPQRGVLMSEDYLTMAEEVQFVEPLWEHMFRKACVQFETWKQIPFRADTAVSIQVSGRSLMDADAMLRLGEHLLEVKPASFNLALGIPEAVFSNRSGAVRDIASRLKERNVHLLLDNFGAGASSLVTLKDLPIDIIRLDRSLIAEDDAGIRFTEAVVTLAHSLDIRVVAGTVETARQRQAMLSAGSDYLQGNGISAPLDTEQATALLVRMSSGESPDGEIGASE